MKYKIISYKYINLQIFYNVSDIYNVFFFFFPVFTEQNIELARSGPHRVLS